VALIGYARVSTAEQDTALQTDALLKAGCERVFEDTVSGVKINKHQVKLGKIPPEAVKKINYYSTQG
jgi:DNA invertase Pin-like site-specific DNA recombinase